MGNELSLGGGKMPLQFGGPLSQRVLRVIDMEQKQLREQPHLSRAILSQATPQPKRVSIQERQRSKNHTHTQTKTSRTDPEENRERRTAVEVTKQHDTLNLPPFSIPPAIPCCPSHLRSSVTFPPQSFSFYSLAEFLRFLRPLFVLPPRVVPSSRND